VRLPQRFAERCGQTTPSQAAVAPLRPGFIDNDGYHAMSETAAQPLEEPPAHIVGQ